MTRSHRSPRRTLSAVSLVLLCGAGAACHRSPQDKARPPFSAAEDVVALDPSTPGPMKFSTTEATAGDPLPLPPVTARVSTVESLTAPSFAPLAGRVVNLNVRLGDRVAEGDRLIEVRTSDLPTLQHERRAAELAIRTRKAVVERIEKLVEARAASQNELTVAQSELDEARLAAQMAAEKIRSLSIKTAGATSYWVLANRAGTVVQLDATPGKQVGPDGDKPIATVADLEDVLVLADVAQRDAPALTPGRTAEIRFPDGAAVGISGTIESVSDVVDPERQTVPVRVRVKNDRKLLRPNAFVSVFFMPPGEATVVGVPASAIVSDGARSVVFVETAAGTYQRRHVEVGRQSKERAEVLSGVRAGERVVSSGALLLLNALDVEG
ncbi:efflux RND transporter periplasmic adaptor subunit [Polyangium mundeleinium]|uniref:Efflux RND transporter periplasmic adaptor subunit n=1 Tax=Polyangium mundeleinium TaxID=2995306 RepID=A0ABT5EK66_9BACT|nr:efflux RND transporter periplasmic adaptor subunit [Polyangium mundeleinium]MDC0742238.1 efflux RND transporter periplasmic adaptor subunit [Polyangium mundeleinium]